MICLFDARLQIQHVDIRVSVRVAEEGDTRAIG